MKLKLLTSAFDDVSSAFDETELEAFIHKHDVIDVQPQFFQYEGRPFWSLLIRYRELRRGEGPSSRGAEVRSQLDAPERARYDRLQAWRRDLAKREGKPPFIILTNRQMGEVARRRPASVAELREIHGIGEKTAERYGPALLAVLEIEEKIQ